MLQLVLEKFDSLYQQQRRKSKNALALLPTEMPVTIGTSAHQNKVALPTTSKYISSEIVLSSFALHY